MSFVSFQFVVFFVAVIAGVALMPTSTARHAFLLVANVAFYAAGTPWFLIVLAVPALVDYACALRIEAATDRETRRTWLVLSLVTNLGILAYFKYADFLIDNVAALLHVEAVPLDVILPVGISFFTFKTMSYTIDVYRGSLAACRSLWRYAMFISFFPELVAGPIVRASVFLPQLDRDLRLSWARTVSGLELVLLGVTKKLLVADRLAPFVDVVWAHPDKFSQGSVLTAIVAYSLQIYCDFSGYTDIAIGTARVLGFDLPENFDMPYLSRSITEFWRRWHMTLSQWLRDYLYIPLGGNRRGRFRTYVNLMLTMLLGGLWHGAAWTFVIWGALHGVALAVHKLVSRNASGHESTGRLASRDVAGWAFTYVFVCFSWVLFRSPDLSTALIVLRKGAGLAPGGIAWTFAPFWILLPAVGAAHAIGVYQSASSRSRPMRDAAPGIPLLDMPFVRGFVLAAWLIVLFLFTPMRRSPFIYFQF